MPESIPPKGPLVTSSDAKRIDSLATRLRASKEFDLSVGGKVYLTEGHFDIEEEKKNLAITVGKGKNKRETNLIDYLKEDHVLESMLEASVDNGIITEKELATKFIRKVPVVDSKGKVSFMYPEFTHRQKTETLALLFDKLGEKQKNKDGTPTPAGKTLVELLEDKLLLPLNASSINHTYLTKAITIAGQEELKGYSDDATYEYTRLTRKDNNRRKKMSEGVVQPTPHEKTLQDATMDVYEEEDVGRQFVMDRYSNPQLQLKTYNKLKLVEKESVRLDLEAARALYNIYITPSELEKLHTLETSYDKAGSPQEKIRLQNQMTDMRRDVYLAILKAMHVTSYEDPTLHLTQVKDPNEKVNRAKAILARAKAIEKDMRSPSVKNLSIRDANHESLARVFSQATGIPVEKVRGVFSTFDNIPQYLETNKKLIRTDPKSKTVLIPHMVDQLSAVSRQQITPEVRGVLTDLMINLGTNPQADQALKDNLVSKGIDRYTLGLILRSYEKTIGQEAEKKLWRAYVSSFPAKTRTSLTPAMEEFFLKAVATEKHLASQGVVVKQHNLFSSDHAAKGLDWMVRGNERQEEPKEDKVKALQERLTQAIAARDQPPTSGLRQGESPTTSTKLETLEDDAVTKAKKALEEAQQALEKARQEATVRAQARVKTEAKPEETIEEKQEEIGKEEIKKPVELPDFLQAVLETPPEQTAGATKETQVVESKPATISVPEDDREVLQIADEIIVNNISESNRQLIHADNSPADVYYSENKLSIDEQVTTGTNTLKQRKLEDPEWYTDTVQRFHELTGVSLSDDFTEDDYRKGVARAYARTFMVGFLKITGANDDEIQQKFVDKLAQDKNQKIYDNLTEKLTAAFLEKAEAVTQKLIPAYEKTAEPAVINPEVLQRRIDQIKELETRLTDFAKSPDRKNKLGSVARKLLYPSLSNDDAFARLENELGDPDKRLGIICKAAANEEIIKLLFPREYHLVDDPRYSLTANKIYHEVVQLVLADGTIEKTQVTDPGTVFADGNINLSEKKSQVHPQLVNKIIRDTDGYVLFDRQNFEAELAQAKAEIEKSATPTQLSKSPASPIPALSDIEASFIGLQVTTSPAESFAKTVKSYRLDHVDVARKIFEDNYPWAKQYADLEADQLRSKLRWQGMLSDDIDKYVAILERQRELQKQQETQARIAPPPQPSPTPQPTPPSSTPTPTPPPSASPAAATEEEMPEWLRPIEPEKPETVEAPSMVASPAVRAPAEAKVSLQYPESAKTAAEKAYHILDLELGRLRILTPEKARYAAAVYEHYQKPATGEKGYEYNVAEALSILDKSGQQVFFVTYGFDPYDHAPELTHEENVRVKFAQKLAHEMMFIYAFAGIDQVAEMRAIPEVDRRWREEFKEKITPQLLAKTLNHEGNTLEENDILRRRDALLDEEKERINYETIFAQAMKQDDNGQVYDELRQQLTEAFLEKKITVPQKKEPDLNIISKTAHQVAEIETPTPPPIDVDSIVHMIITLTQAESGKDMQFYLNENAIAALIRNIVYEKNAQERSKIKKGSPREIQLLTNPQIQIDASCINCSAWANLLNLGKVRFLPFSVPDIKNKMVEIKLVHSPQNSNDLIGDWSVGIDDKLLTMLKKIPGIDKIIAIESLSQLTQAQLQKTIDDWDSQTPPDKRPGLKIGEVKFKITDDRKLLVTVSQTKERPYVSSPTQTEESELPDWLKKVEPEQPLETEEEAPPPENPASKSIFSN